MTIMNFVTPKAGAKHGLLFNEPATSLNCDVFAKETIF